MRRCELKPTIVQSSEKGEISGAQIKTPVSENRKSFVFTFLLAAIHSSWIIHHVRSTSVALPMWSSGWWYFLLHSRCNFSPIDIIFSRPGDSACSNSQALVPVSVSMSSVRKKKLGSDKCADGNLETLCTTKKKPFSTITLDFGKPVEIGKVPTVFAKTINRLKLRWWCHSLSFYNFP